MELASLWLPILLSAVFVFVVSSVLHMMLPIHKGDYKQVPGEASLLAEMRKHSVGPGVYMFPHAPSMKDCKSPEYLEKYRQGPVGVVTVMAVGPTPSMGKNLVQWFFFCLLISCFSAYVCTLLPAGTGYGVVFRWAGTVAILGYSASNLADSIWGGRPWGITLKYVFDGIVYGLVTAGTFGWLWPQAM
jgi:hypothetical protein